MSAEAAQPLRVAGIDVGTAAIKLVLLEEAPERAPEVLVAGSERIRRRLRDRSAQRSHSTDRCWPAD